jgi:hypothetical protein
MIHVQSTAPQLFEAWAHDIISTPLARRSDPATSHAAAVHTRHFTGRQKALILQALRTHGPMSPAQMFDYTGLSIAQIDRRGKEMRVAGLVRFKRLDDGAIAVHARCNVWELCPTETAAQAEA